jgi:hypothetical protein
MGELQRLPQKRSEIFDQTRIKTSAEDHFRLRAEVQAVDAAVRVLDSKSPDSNLFVREYLNPQDRSLSSGR